MRLTGFGKGLAAAVLFSSVSFLLPQSPLYADDESGHRLRVEDIGIGSCVPDPVVVTHLIDCRFPLLSPVNDSGVAQALIEGVEPGFSESGRSWLCRVDADELICERLFAAGVGDVTVGVEVDGVLVRGRASVSILGYGLPAEVRIGGTDPTPGQIQVLIAGSRIGIETRRRTGTGTVWLLARTWPDRRRVESLQVLDDTQSESFVDELVLADPGHYEFVLCNGAEPDDCVEGPSGRRLQVIVPDVEELIAGHNLLEGERVNLVVTGGGWDSVDRFTEVARTLFDPSALPIPSPDGDDVWWPPFTIEPFASNGHLFNLWVLPTQVDPLAITQGDGIESPVAAAFDLKDATFLHLQADPIRQGGWANQPSFWESTTPPGGIDDLVLGSAINFVDPSHPAAAAQGVAHELGHSVFGLIDEYQRDAMVPTLGPPNCAVDHVQAESWWGDLIGEVDSQLVTYRKVMERQNLWTDQMEATLEDDLTVGFVDGWCLYPTKEAVIPTRRSLMNDNFPVFGSVNRRYAELVLQRWTGTAPLSTKHLPEALTENCTTTRTTTDCQFEVQPFLTKPSDSIRIRIGPKTVTCSLTSSVAQEPGLIECPPVEHDGNLLEVSIDNGPWIKVAQVPQPEDPAQSEPTIPAAPQTLGSQASADPESVGWPRAAFWMAAISLVIATTVIMTRHLIKRGR